MHEEALLRDLRRELLEVARRERVDRITRVRLRVGALCHVSPETLRSRWRELVADTPARDAALEIESSPDPRDSRAQDVVLADVVVEEPGSGTPPTSA